MTSISFVWFRGTQFFDLGVMIANTNKGLTLLFRLIPLDTATSSNNLLTQYLRTCNSEAERRHSQALDLPLSCDVEQTWEVKCLHWFRCVGGERADRPQWVDVCGGCGIPAPQFMSVV